ncbi:helix-turn-helix domain-containing protein [Seonamhaeicola marinus]|uniref:AraC family transcriptional regulator n=1 Tax=Seonamhaeicola marinus TaxID=1912246 RepID=A0A5D0HIA0_9FLAO|nr:helix-turn-helix domain-containing protein [Seonamhaeicola marinus]TYA69999.1 AraC family transcriptional regulator [Seonamhaeicola marinus]
MNAEGYIEIGFFSGIILMAFFHGILLASIFLFHKRLNAKSNRFLALSILGICVILGYEFVFWLSLEDYVSIWIQYLPIYIRTVIPVGIFYFVVFLIQPKHKLSKFEKLGFVFIGIEILLHIIYTLVSLFTENLVIEEITETYTIMISWFLSIVCGLIFLPMALKRVNTYQRYLYNNYSTTHKKSLGWLKTFLILLLIIVCITTVSFIQYWLGHDDEGDTTFSIITLAFVILLFWISYFLIIYYNWFEIVPIEHSDADKASNQNKLSANTSHYYGKLLTLMSEEKIYEDVNLTLDKISEKLQISSGYVSQIIKENEQKNFFEFINFYRIEAVKKKLLEDDYSNYTIMGVALESGFNSKSTFNAVFKKFTNETPSAFKRRHA